MQSELDFSLFEKALKTLQQAVDAHEMDPSNEFVRDACIKRFEYTYEAATKIIVRYLSLTELDPSAVTGMTAQATIRRAYQIGLIPNSWDRWQGYRDDRSTTAHAYSQEKAEELLERIPLFVTEAKALLTSLKKYHET